MAFTNEQSMDVCNLTESKEDTAIPATIESHLDPLEDLDPSLELTLDLQTLIDKASEQQEATAADQLFPELARGVHSEDGNYIKIQPEEAVFVSGSTLADEVNILEGLKSERSVDLYEENIDYSPVEVKKSTRGRPRSNLKAPSSKSASSRRRISQDTEEYKDRRERNNIAVRKSREKARQRQQETTEKVKILADKNEELQKKVDLLTKELTVLKGLFMNIGASIPKNLDKYSQDIMQEI